MRGQGGGEGGGKERLGGEIRPHSDNTPKSTTVMIHTVRYF